MTPETSSNSSEVDSEPTEDIGPDPGGRTRSFREHYAASQFRVETWNQLRSCSESLSRARAKGRPIEALREEARETIDLLSEFERYWAFPGKIACAELERLCQEEHYDLLARGAASLVRALVSDSYRNRDSAHAEALEPHSQAANDREELHGAEIHVERPYFEVLIVGDLDDDEQEELRARLRDVRADDDEFVYDVVFVPSFEDAIIATLFNHNLQSCILRYRFPLESDVRVPELRHYVRAIPPELLALSESDPCHALGEAITQLRPELDLYKVTDDTFGSVSVSATRCFRRVFYRSEDYHELHLCILKGIHERYETPFFDALKDYSHQPTGVFHALPISRGKSITKSHWIRDMGRFYGRNIFLAETSSTTGGLDSLLQPTGSLKHAQEKVTRAFGSRQSFFVTNGTSTANKIVTQALVRPGDIVLLSHDCHKSHPYALVLAGAHPVYMDAYALDRYTIFGGVPLREMKRHLLALKRAGKLDRVRMLLLTNSTFDGIVYDPERIMCEILAIKPDMIFLWDEAWFAFARATPTYRRRTAMEAAKRMRERFKDEAYRAEYSAWAAKFESNADDDEAWLDTKLLPDPARARLRVYATHSTHKTLTSLRQGSMIHVFDQDYEKSAKGPFHEAYMTHTSTSPNYQILASLDVGRRQLELEGYEFVRHSVGIAMMIRRQIVDDPLLSKYFRVLRAKDMIPEEFRPSGLERFYDPEEGFTRMEDHWMRDEFALDPTRISLNVGATGMNGDEFRKMLSARFDIQINKTSRNTVLFIVNIGSSRGSATYLLDVLTRIADELEARAEDDSDLDREIARHRVHSLVEDLPPLPHFSRFHPAFVTDPTGGTPEGDLRSAFFLAYREEACEHLALDGTISDALASGREVVSAAFVTPYPPGFPVLVPGQVVTSGILDYLKAVDVKEIHGYEPTHGIRVFREDALESLVSSPRPSLDATTPLGS